jgi:L,D-transpeptidase catalytic domain
MTCGLSRRLREIGMMKRLRLIAIAFLVAGLACAASAPAFANILIQIDKPSQTMTVSVDGQLLYRWPVSTGATGFSTPDGSYTPFRMEVMHYSQEWDNAGMPHAIFFTSRGHSIHGSDHPGLGTPVSHGCVRLSLPNAATLYDLVTAEGMGKTTVIVSGDDPPGYYEPSQPPQQKRPFAPFGGLFRF